MGGPKSQTINVTIQENAPPGPVPIRIVATLSDGRACTKTATLKGNSNTVTLSMVGALYTDAD
jgi:hypothetical protein